MKKVRKVGRWEDSQGGKIILDSPGGPHMITGSLEGGRRRRGAGGGTKRRSEEGERRRGCEPRNQGPPEAGGGGDAGGDQGQMKS